MAPTRQYNQPKKAVFPLCMDKDPDEADLEYVKHRVSETDNNGRTQEIQERCPKLTDKSTPLQIMKFFSQFALCCCHLGWTTGPLLFQHFQLHLEGVHVLTWEGIVGNHAATVNHFDTDLAKLKQELLSGYRYYD